MSLKSRVYFMLTAHIPIRTSHISNAQQPHVADGNILDKIQHRVKQFLTVLSVLKTLLLLYCQN